MIYRPARDYLRRGDFVLRHRDSFDILMEIRFSGVAKRLLWEMSDDNAFLFLNDPVGGC